MSVDRSNTSEPDEPVSLSANLREPLGTVVIAMTPAALANLDEEARICNEDRDDVIQFYVDTIVAMELGDPRFALDQFIAAREAASQAPAGATPEITQAGLEELIVRDGINRLVNLTIEAAAIETPRSSPAERLARIAERHAATGPDGSLAGDCPECGRPRPCPTYVWSVSSRDAVADPWDPLKEPLTKRTLDPHVTQYMFGIPRPPQ